MPQPPPPPRVNEPVLNYQTPPPPRAVRFAAWPAVVLGVAWAETAVALGVVVRRFEVVFKDFRVELPLATKLALGLSRWWANDYGWLLALFAATVAAVGLGFVLPPRPAGPSTRRGRYGLPLILLLAFTLLLVAGLLLTVGLAMLALVEAINGK